MIDTITKIDFTILDMIQSFFKCGFLDWFMPKITLLGNGGIFFIALSLVLVCFKKTRKTALMLAAGFVLCFLLGNLTLKPLIARVRPFYINESVLPLLIKTPGEYSFPSGHTLISFTAAFIIMRRDIRFGVPMLILAIIIAFSRLYLYVHYPSDILGGIVLAAIISFAVFKLSQRQEKSRS